MKLNIKIVYTISFAIGVISILIYFFAGLEEIKSNAILSIGSGFLSSSILAACVDYINEKNEIKKIKKLRKSLLQEIENSILIIAKKVVEAINQQELSQKKFIDVFIDYTRIIEFIGDCKDLEIEKLKSLIHHINRMILSCKKYCSFILDNKYALIINGIFTKREIQSFGYISDACDGFHIQGLISENGEYLRILVQTAHEYIPEIRKKLDKKISICNKRIEKWKGIIDL